MGLFLTFMGLLASIPIGYILKYLTKEELDNGRKYFKVIWIFCLIIAIGFLFFPLDSIEYKKSIIFTLLFIADVVFISWRK